MTYLDQKIMFTINSNEFLEQAWIRSERKEKSPHIVIMTKRFNDVSEGIYRLDRGVFLKISSYFSTCQTQNLIILLWHRGLLFQIYNLHKIALYEPTSPSSSHHTKLWRTCKTLILRRLLILRIISLVYLLMSLQYSGRVLQVCQSLMILEEEIEVVL